MTEKELREYFLNTAEQYIGYSEASGKHRKIIDIYNAHKPLARSYAVKYTDEWCATFVSAMSIKAGLTDIIPTECSCQRQIELFKKLGSWVENDSFVPQRGDIIYYDWGDSGVGDNTGWADHVGIVSSVSGGKISVLEGNRGDSVGYRTIAVNGKTIRGFAVPNYASKADAEKPEKEDVFELELKELRRGDKGKSVKALQILLIGYGYSCGSTKADGSFGKNTEKAVKNFQSDNKLSVDGVAGKKTFGALLK